MKLAKTLACISLVSLTALAACSDQGDGYYDSRGNYHWSGAKDPANASYDMKADRSINPSGDDNYYVDHSAVRGDSMKVSGYRRDKDPEISPYKRMGYYDYNGTYYASNAGPNIPRSYFPRKGLCRVWFMDRDAVDQPAIESCRGIQNRVPDGAYVVYGG